MKNLIRATFSLLILLVSVSFTSCKKDNGEWNNLELKGNLQTGVSIKAFLDNSILDNPSDYTVRIFQKGVKRSEKLALGQYSEKEKSLLVKDNIKLSYNNFISVPLVPGEYFMVMICHKTNSYTCKSFKVKTMSRLEPSFYSKYTFDTLTYRNYEGMYAGWF